MIQFLTNLNKRSNLTTIYSNNRNSNKSQHQKLQQNILKLNHMMATITITVYNL